MRNILILNGCPGSGKDTVSDYLVANYNYKTIAFKDSAYKAVYEHYNITKEEYASIITECLYEIGKKIVGKVKEVK